MANEEDTKQTASEEVKNKLYQYRRRGCLKMTYEALANLLGMYIGSIQFMQIEDDPGLLMIYHTDERQTVFDLAEGQTCPQTRLNLEYAIQEWAERLTRMGWTVTPPKEETDAKV